MAKLPTLAVIIPVYNQAQTIDRCLKSLLNQTLKPQEIIVVDDGSTDGSVDKVRSLVSSYPLIKCFSQTHQGPAAARNLAAAKAKAEILIFVDADMEFDPGFLDQLIRPIVTGRAQGTWSGNEWAKNWNNIWARCWNYNQGLTTARRVGNQKGQRKVFRAILKSEFDKVRGFDHVGYTDDWTLGQKLNYQPVVTTAKFYHHNPETLLKVFKKARWIGKRQYKLGRFGAVMTILRANAAASLLTGLVKAVRFFTPGFIVFKLVYDLGILIGASQSLFFRQKY